MAAPLIPILIGAGALTVLLVKSAGSSVKKAADLPAVSDSSSGTIPGGNPTAGYVVVPIESVSKSPARPSHEDLVMLLPGRIITAFMAIPRNDEPTKVILARLAVTERAIGDLSGEDDVRAKFLGVESASPISFKEGDPLPKEGTTFPVRAKEIFTVEKNTSASGLVRPRAAFWRTRR